jgi:hypothetical protein
LLIKLITGDCDHGDPGRHGASAERARRNTGRAGGPAGSPARVTGPGSGRGVCRSGRGTATRSRCGAPGSGCRSSRRARRGRGVGSRSRASEEGAGDESTDAREARQLKPWRCAGRGPRAAYVDLQRIYEFLEPVDPGAAARVVRTVVARVRRIPAQPVWERSGQASGAAKCAGCSFIGTKRATRSSDPTSTCYGSSIRARIVRLGRATAAGSRERRSRLAPRWTLPRSVSP